MDTTPLETTPTVGSPSINEPLVCRKIVRFGVVVATWHPVLGPLYWEFVDESDCNASNYYGITDYLKSATVFRSGYYNGYSFEYFKGRCLDGLLDHQGEWNPNLEDHVFVKSFSWRLCEYAKKANCTPQEFSDWIDDTVWVEYPAPLKIYFLSDFNGLMGYRLEHSEDIKEALHWSAEYLADKEDLDVELASSWGHFVPLSQALMVSPVERKPSKVNDALEADCALTLHRLGLQKRRDWDKQESGMASWSGDLRETAWIHAACAGVAYVRSGEVLPVSGHITTFPDLFKRFNMAVALMHHKTF